MTHPTCIHCAQPITGEPLRVPAGNLHGRCERGYRDARGNQLFVAARRALERGELDLRWLW